MKLKLCESPETKHKIFCPALPPETGERSHSESYTTEAEQVLNIEMEGLIDLFSDFPYSCCSFQLVIHLCFFLDINEKFYSLTLSLPGLWYRRTVDCHVFLFCRGYCENDFDRLP